MFGGALTGRGGTRVHRLAWSVADLRGVHRPGVDEVEVALRLRRGDPLLVESLRAGGDPMSDADRIARVALSRLGEPGDPRLSALVAELGAVRVCDYLREERDATGVATDVAARLAGLDPVGRAGARGPGGHPVRGARRRRVAPATR